ncbi:TetR/AcrR family transcriptional regulator [Massilia cavernae]|uniref:TetR/AcrR family transcriptional regulator n=1 Tax=Massilia cavernae TaxID=2320864 RepID=A0A418XFK5_9BURK|nr:TetR/AcrR family transcriptional regulator [Massilia cavernae]RJG11243.1 TetR/AcrR family transcriptional regulator [Massilia cavernae]
MQASGKSTKGELSRERILSAASRAVRRAGHSGASVAEVMKEAGLTHGGFYAHFTSRDEMVAGAIAFAGAQSNDSLLQSMAALQKKGASPFRSLIDAYLSPAHMAAVETGCVVAALGSEMPRQPDLIRQAARERVVALIRMVESVLPAGADKSAAPHIASAMAGALQMARILGGDEGSKLLDLNRAALAASYP